MYYTPVKLSELPLGKISKTLKIVSAIGVIGYVESAEFKDSRFWVTIAWENGSTSIQEAECLRNVYALVYTHDINAFQIETINQHNQPNY